MASGDIHISANLIGAKELQAKLSKIISKGDDLTRPFRDSVVQMIGSIRRNFREEGRPDRWPESQRVILGQGERTLRITGALMNSVNGRASKRRMTIGSNLDYAAIHQFGGSTPPHVIEPVNAKALRWFGPGGGAIFAKRVNHPGSEIPARRFAMFHKDDRKFIVDRVSRHVNGRR